MRPAKPTRAILGHARNAVYLSGDDVLSGSVAAFRRTGRYARLARASPYALSYRRAVDLYSGCGALFSDRSLFGILCGREADTRSTNKSFREIFLGIRRHSTKASRAERELLAAESGEMPSPGDKPRAVPKDMPTTIQVVPIVAFVISMVRDVILNTRNYPYYIVMIIPSIEMMIWGNSSALMQNDQFHYTKQAQADWAWPIQILSFLILTPFAGWYSDVRGKVRWWLRILLLALSTVCFFRMLSVLHMLFG